MSADPVDENGNHILPNGLPLDFLDNQVLSTLSTTQRINFGIEFQFAPALTMIRLPNAFVTAFDDNVEPFDLDSAIPPLELDNVFCSRASPTTPPSPTDEYPMPRFPVPNLPCVHTPSHPNDCDPAFYSFGGFNIDIKRVKADLTVFRITAPDFTAFPTPAGNSVNISASIENVELAFRTDVITGGSGDPSPPDYVVTAGRINIFCNLAAGPTELTTQPNGTDCGEIPISCTSFTANVNISALSGALPILPPGSNDASHYRELIQDVIKGVLVAGTKLHFEGFSAEGRPCTTAADCVPGCPTATSCIPGACSNGRCAYALTVDRGLALRLVGAPKNGCSHTPAPPPIEGPVRGLSRIRSVVGKVERVGSLGSVIEFDVVPSVKLDWSSPTTGTNAFLDWTAPPTATCRAFGSELHRPRPELPTGINASIDVTRRVKNGGCWVTPTRLLEPIQPPCP